MNYHAIKTNDMLNGDGLRVVLFVSGCCHQCYGCHNPQTWDEDSGVLFGKKARSKLFEELRKDHISGVTLSGGDPLFKSNLKEISQLISDIHQEFGSKKTIWLYTGYEIEKLLTGKESKNLNDKLRLKIIKSCDVVVDGEFIEELADVKFPWAGSTNQRVWRLTE